MPSSCCQITRSTALAPRPPYSFGQFRHTQPPSAFFFCHAFATSTMSCFCSLMRPSEAFESSASNSRRALASIQARASARKVASCGVSSKFIVHLLAPPPHLSLKGGGRRASAGRGSSFLHRDPHPNPPPFRGRE